MSDQKRPKAPAAVMPRTPKKRRSAGDYEVGWCKPPKAMQFKKGQKGNPNGRPKKVKENLPDVFDMAQRISNMPMALADGRRMEGLEAFIRTLWNNAVGKGNTRAAKLYIDLLAGRLGSAKVSTAEIDRLVEDRLFEIDEERHREASAGAEKFVQDMERLNKRMQESGWRLVRFEPDGSLAACSEEGLSLAEILSLRSMGPFDEPAE